MDLSRLALHLRDAGYPAYAAPPPLPADGMMLTVKLLGDPAQYWQTICTAYHSLSNRRSGSRVAAARYLPPPSAIYLYQTRGLEQNNVYASFYQ